MELPSLSVVIPNFNHGHLIGDQLRSVFSQTVQCSRIIIIDDASTDNSVLAIRQLISGHQNVELVCKLENSGVSEIMNEGLRLAESECVAFLAADDTTLPDFFEKSLNLLSSYPDAALCSGVVLVQYHAGNYAVPSWTTYPSLTPGFLGPARVRELLLRNDSWIAGNTTIFRRQPLLAAGGFDPELESFSDGFISRVLALRHGACFIPEPLAIWRRVDSGYAGSTSGDEHKLERILISSNDRMKTIYSELFPPALLARCSARMLFVVFSAKLDRLEQRTRSIVEAVRPMAGSSLLLLAMRLSKYILKVSVFLFLRPYDTARIVLPKLLPRRPAASAFVQPRAAGRTQRHVDDIP